MLKFYNITKVLQTVRQFQITATTICTRKATDQRLIKTSSSTTITEQKIEKRNPLSNKHRALFLLLGQSKRDLQRFRKAPRRAAHKVH